MSRSLRVIALAMVMSIAGALAFSVPAGAGRGRIGKITVKHARFDWTANRTAAEVAALKAAPNAAGTIKTFTTSVTDGASTFTYTMVGKNPFVTQAKPSTTVKVSLIPVVVKFSNGDSWDPSAIDSCDSQSALTRVENSPIFKAQTWTFGGTSVGKAQYVDAFQRANFYSKTNPGGINPGYHVKLAVTVHSALTLNVPNADAAEGSTVCGSGKLGAVPIAYMDGQLQSYISGTLGSAATTTFPLFLLGNVVMFNGTTSNCCILGYHNAMTNAGKFQTYGISMYDNTGEFTGSADISALSHEVAEWMNDPNTVNPTKPWGHIGQVSGCQSNLEVGDPLSGTTITRTLNGKTYHPQELAFFSWFYHSSPSLGVNGWFSSNGTFTSSAAACS